MIGLVRKIVSTASPLVSIDPSACGRMEIVSVGKGIEKKVKKLFRGSLAIRQVDAGSDNAVEQELVALSNPFYDVERFGIHFVASPRHADMLMATGPVTRNMAEAVRRAYAATPSPKVVVAVGDDAIDGGIFRGSYAVLDAVKNVIPVDYEIPGDPPSPLTILCSLLKILETIERSAASH
jgi:Ni,Fe-hydrogenase III small subunit